MYTLHHGPANCDVLAITLTTCDIMTPNTSHATCSIPWNRVDTKFKSFASYIFDTISRCATLFSVVRV